MRSGLALGIPQPGHRRIAGLPRQVVWKLTSQAWCMNSDANPGGEIFLPWLLSHTMSVTGRGGSNVIPHSDGSSNISDVGGETWYSRASS